VAVGLEIVVELKPVGGDQLYVYAPVGAPPSNAVPPLQIEALAPALATGGAPIVTVIEALAAGHGPPGALVVKVSVTVPLVIDGV